MRYNINSLIGYTIGATDGEIGRIKDFYFDDDTWVIRYLVVDTGEWLFSRKILISPQAILIADWDNRIFNVGLSKDQIRKSPDIDTEKPVSRQQEIKLQNHYQWSGYLNNSLYTGNAPVSVYEALSNNADPIDINKSADDPHLRSTSMLIGYSVKAIDGRAGDVNNLMLSDITWRLDYMVVDTGHWWLGKRVLVSLSWIKEIGWKNSTVTIIHTIETVKNSPAYVPGQPLSEKYQLKLHDHFKNSRPM